MQYVYKLFCIGIAQFREIVWADIYDMFYKDVWAHKRKFMLFLFGQLDTILHMSQQIYWRDMCKFMTWLDHWNNHKSKANVLKLSIMSS